MPPRVDRTRNVAEINRILRDPSVYPSIRDDTSPHNAEDFDAGVVLDRKDVDFYGVFDGDEMVGVWLVLFHGDVAEVHTNFLPSHRGKFAQTAALMFLDELFQVEGINVVSSYVPSYNEAAYKFAKWCGLHDTGIRQEAFMRDGVAYPVREVSIKRSEWCEV